MGLDSVKYDAFISYRHCELDSFVSENLHKKLENFKLPKSVYKNKNLKKTKIERVFRDEAELPLSDNLSDPIMAALANSEFLIVICTPRLPLSAWCKKEVETFVATHDRQHVLLVLAEGEPDESFPEILTYEDVMEKDLDGKEVTIRRTREPLAADCRGNTNKERLKAMDNVVIKLCAAIFGLNYDDLKQRHREQKIKRRIVLMEIVMALVALFALVCILFTVRIQKQNKIIQDKYASSMASAADELYDSGRRLDAIYVARSVLPDRETKDYNEDAYRALVDAMNVYGASDSYVPKNLVSIPSSIIDYVISPDQKKMALYGFDEKLYIVDIETNEIIYSNNAVGLYDMDFSGNEGLIYSIGYLVDEKKTVYFDLVSKEEKVLEDCCGNVESANSKGMTFTFSTYGVKAYKADSLYYEINYFDYGLNPNEYWNYLDSAFSSDENYCTFALKEDPSANGAILCQFETDTGDIDMFVRDKNIGSNAALATSGDYVFVSFLGEEEDSIHEITHLLRYDVLNSTSANGVIGKLVETSDSYQVILSDYEYCIYGNNQAMIFDYDLNLQGTLSRATMILNGYVEDEDIHLIDSNGKVFLLNGFFYDGMDLTAELFPQKSDKKLLYAVNKGDNLYVKYEEDSSYITVMQKEKGEFADVLSKTGVDEFVQSSQISNPDFLDKIDVDKKTVYVVLESDDGKYYSVQNYDGALTIYDAKTLKEVKKLYVNGMLDRFVYLKNIKSYAMFGGDEEYLFDRKFKCYSTLPYGTLCGVTDDKEKDLVLVNGAGDYFRVDIKSYNEIIKKADEILGDYVPEDKIIDKYNITVGKRRKARAKAGIGKLVDLLDK